TFFGETFCGCGADGRFANLKRRRIEMRVIRWIAFVLLVVAQSCLAQEVQGWEQLLGVHREVLELRDAGMKGNAHYFSPGTVQMRASKLRKLQSDLLAISRKTWAVPLKVDWVLVRTELN